VVGTGNSLNVPVVVMRPMLLPLDSVNQSALSGPEVIALGPDEEVGMGNSVMLPFVVMRPILLVLSSVNQRALSGPVMMPAGS